MSLDIDLYFEVQTGSTIEPPHKQIVYSASITHNLSVMANKADIYYPLWHLQHLSKVGWNLDTPIIQAKELLPYLKKGLVQLRTYPEFFKQFNAENDWGTYKDFVPWIEELLVMCEKYPNALLEVSR